MVGALFAAANESSTSHIFVPQSICTQFAHKRGGFRQTDMLSERETARSANREIPLSVQFLFLKKRSFFIGHH